MPIIHVATAFNFLHDDGQTQRFAVGQHEVSDALASDPYVLAHLGEAPAPSLTEAALIEAQARIAALEAQVASLTADLAAATAPPLKK